MKISELMAILQQAYLDHGDLPVVLADSEEPSKEDVSVVEERMWLLDDQPGMLVYKSGKAVKIGYER
jgi:hypothetical protein